MGSSPQRGGAGEGLALGDPAPARAVVAGAPAERLPRGMLEVAVAPGLGLDRAPARGIGGEERGIGLDPSSARSRATPGSGVRRSAAPAPWPRKPRARTSAGCSPGRRSTTRCSMPLRSASGGRPAPGARASGSRGSRPSRGPYAADGLTGPPVRLYNRAMAVQTPHRGAPAGSRASDRGHARGAAPPAATAAWRAQLQPPPDPPLPARHPADNARVSRPLRRRVLGADVPPGDGGDARPGREPLRHGVRRRQLQLARGDVRRTADPADRRRADHDRLGVPRPRAQDHDAGVSSRADGRRGRGDDRRDAARARALAPGRDGRRLPLDARPLDGHRDARARRPRPATRVDRPRGGERVRARARVLRHGDLVDAAPRSRLAVGADAAGAPRLGPDRLRGDRPPQSRGCRRR